MKVPFFSSNRQDEVVSYKIEKAILDVINEGSFVSDIQTRSFEEEFAKENNVKHCVMTSSGTSALEIALRSMKIVRPILTTANSFCATASAVKLAEKKLIFCDTDKSCNININDIERNIQLNKIFGQSLNHPVLAVNLYGNPIDHEKLWNLSKKHNFPVILDLAQSHFTKYKDKNPAEFADISCFSFYPTKTLGAYGDAGCLLTNNDDTAELARSLRNHGRGKEQYTHDFIARNDRCDEIQSAILRVKLKSKKWYIYGRRLAAQRYKNNLKDYSHILLNENPDATDLIYYVFPIFHPKRDELKQYLESQGISTVIHYPFQLPKLKAHSFLYPCPEGEFPNSYKQCSQTLSLPFYANIPNDEIDYVCEHVIKFLKNIN